MKRKLMIAACMFFGAAFIFAVLSCQRGSKNPVATPVSTQVKAGDAVLTCNIDADCTLVKEDCCGCNAGGKQRAIAANAAEAWLNQMSCDDVFCAQVISRDPSCSQKAACVLGRCELK